MLLNVRRAISGNPIPTAAMTSTLLRCAVPKRMSGYVVLIAHFPMRSRPDRSLDPKASIFVQHFDVSHERPFIQPVWRF
ncbi:hypothetical protein THIOKS140007 [Thiocapsa sp. KS1]|nr:hypothetical protein THIOKS140007 [Thiocapsa sp. KS1]